MARNKHVARKIRLGKLNKLTKWAPFWVALKRFGKRKIHPSRMTRVKRSWRRTKTKA